MYKNEKSRDSEVVCDVASLSEAENELNILLNALADTSDVIADLEKALRLVLHTSSPVADESKETVEEELVPLANGIRSARKTSEYQAYRLRDMKCRLGV